MDVTKKFAYSVDCHGKFETEAPHLVDVFDLIEDPAYYAELAAEDYWNNHDGWEDNWPLTFLIYENEDADEVCGEVLVEMEMEPMFMGRKKEA